ncbi:hypothetical protein KFE25_005950 [Diacronema lutheri]|uniref:Reticulon-like protein n=1 Tax=Diacronema lutheri TaxID=2081491 RepID=A0A8J5Y197_DIALT|nr:hypothetical protein KFE25_005950 [Diacronema lutheri]
MAMVFALHVTLIGTLAPTRARIAPAVRSTPHAPTASFPSAAEGWRRLGAALESPRGAAALAPASCALATLCAPAELWAATPSGYDANSVFDPRGFQPVCGASDGVYRALQGLIQAMVGDASYREYSPLIAGSLLRVRLELCVVESFFNEAIAPFIRERGLSWVLPLHETVETFLAGVVFAVATNFILIGSTKIVTVLVTYADVFFGFPVRLLSGAAWDSVAKSLRPKKEPPPPPATPLEWVQRAITRDQQPEREKWTDTLSAAEGTNLALLLLFGSARVAGGTSKACRQAAEALDTFVGRYLLLTTVAYVGVKLVHFKLFPDIF